MALPTVPFSQMKVTGAQLICYFYTNPLASNHGP